MSRVPRQDSTGDALKIGNNIGGIFGGWQCEETSRQNFQAPYSLGARALTVFKVPRRDGTGDAPRIEGNFGGISGGWQYRQNFRARYQWRETVLCLVAGWNLEWVVLGVISSMTPASYYFGCVALFGGAVSWGSAFLRSFDRSGTPSVVLSQGRLVGQMSVGTTGWPPPCRR